MTSISTTLQLGIELKKARKKIGLTQSELALAAGVGLRFMVELEAGKPTLRLSHVLKVIHALGGTFAIDGLATVSSPLTR